MPQPPLRERIQADIDAEKALAKLCQKGCDRDWLLQTLEMMPICDDFVVMWRRMAGKGSRELNRAIETIHRASRTIFKINRALSTEISFLFYRHPSVPMLDHQQGLGAENLPWLLGEYISLLKLLDRAAGQGHPQIRGETESDRLGARYFQLRQQDENIISGNIEYDEEHDRPKLDEAGRIVFLFTRRDGSALRIPDDPPPPPQRPAGYPPIHDLIKWAIVRHVKESTGEFYDAEVSALIGTALRESNYDQGVHRMWRFRNAERLGRMEGLLRILPAFRDKFPNRRST